MQTHLQAARTGLLIVDPQVDLLSPDGGAWDLFGPQVTSLSIVPRLAALREAAERAGVTVFYSRVEVPAEAYDDWKPRNGLQTLFGERRLMKRGGGAAFMPELAPTDNTVLLSPRLGPSSLGTDLRRQLDGRGIDTVLVAGMVANLCVESHVRELTEHGTYAVAIADAMGTTSDEALEATVANFGLFATEVVGTDEVLAGLGALATARN